MQDNSFLISEKTGRLMRKYAVPCVISLVTAALYNIVDQIFIANADYLGSFGNAANTVVFPLTVIALAVAVMIGDGSCAFVSISLGAGRREEAHISVGNAVILSASSGLLIAAVYLLLADGIITAFGARVNDETFRLSREYFFWISLGIPFYMFGQAMNPIIRSDGSPRFAMAATLAGAAANIVLDPILIFPLRMGMAGAAIATVAGQVLTAALSAGYLFKMKLVKLKKESFRLNFKIAFRSLALGITSLLSQISLVAAMAAINNMLREYGARDVIFSRPEYAQIPMAVVGIVMKFFQIVISISVGIAAGCIPIVGYNVGAGRRDRVAERLKKLLFSEFAVGAIALLIVELFPRALIGAFGAANESAYYTDFAVKSFRIYLCLMPLATVNKSTFIFLQAVGKALPSVLLSLVREVVFGVGFALLLPIAFGLDGVLYSMPVSDLLTFVIGLCVIFSVFRELHGGKSEKIAEI